MIGRFFRFLFPIVLLGGIGIAIYWFWTGNLPQTENIKTGTESLGNKLKEMAQGNRNEDPGTVPQEAIRNSTITINDETFSIEVASTPKDRQKGLMHRASLDEDNGMLFIFDQIDVYPFWMPNVNFPLDIVWIDENFMVVDVKTVPPCEDKVIKNCPSYKPDGAAKYVLEVNANHFPGMIGDKTLIDWN